LRQNIFWGMVIDPKRGQIFAGKTIWNVHLGIYIEEGRGSLEQKLLGFLGW